jgi:hypothetical protein
MSATGEMAGHGYYDHHSLAQHSAGSFGFPLLERAAAAVPLDDATGALVIADLGAAGGANELEPMRLAIDGLRGRGCERAVSVVHTDIPSNDFSTLFENVEGSPDSYLHQPGVFAFAAGRSFYERIFPGASVTLGWSGIAVHWLSRVPEPVPDHVYCAFATGDARAALARQSAEDWRGFLTARAAELVPGGQVVVVGGAASDDGTSGAEALMDALDASLRDAVAAKRLAADEYAAMTIPTWNRTAAEFAAPFAPDGSTTAAGLTLVEQGFQVLDDPYLAAYRESGDADAFATAASGFLRAFTEPSLIEPLDRPQPERTAIADVVYAGVRARLAADPARFETRWRVALLRIARSA